MDVLNQILNINAGGAYGGGKAGGAFDPLTFAMKPQVVIRALCWVSKVNHIHTYMRRILERVVYEVMQENQMHWYFNYP